jgi:hypothetical protein
MKIICIDNLARESVSDRLVADNITSSHEADIIIKALLATCTNEGSHWYKIVDDNYKLWEFLP